MRNFVVSANQSRYNFYLPNKNSTKVMIITIMYIDCDGDDDDSRTVAGSEICATWK